MSNTYILATGEGAKERLEFQNQLSMELSIQHLEKAGLKAGMTVLDMGCGVGAMTNYLAKAVGSNGKVYAVDVSKAQLKIAEEKAKSESIDNIVFIESNIYSNLDIPAVDLIYMRFVLMHITNPLQALINLKNYLKPNGVVVSQEPIISTFQAVSGYADILISLGKQQNVDYNIGQSSQNLFLEAGYNPVNVEYKQMEITGQKMKKFCQLSLSEWGNKAVDSGFITIEIINSLLEKVSLLNENEEYLSGKQAYILAWNN